MTAVEAEIEFTPGLADYIVERGMAEMAAGIAEWSRTVTRLAHWQDAHLLDDPASEDLARNLRAIRKLLRFGRFIARATDHPDFPDPALALQVRSALEVLADMERAWSRPATLTLAEADAVLAQCGL